MYALLYVHNIKMYKQYMLGYLSAVCPEKRTVFQELFEENCEL